MYNVQYEILYEMVITKYMKCVWYRDNLLINGGRVNRNNYENIQKTCLGRY